jgi:Icc-related predicted phosphoesterase
VTKVTFIGDVHGKYERYKKIIDECANTIQVGDMGVGFFKRDHEGVLQAFANPPYDKMVAGGHRFIRGNHDNPDVCSRHTQCIRDGTVEDGVMFIGGALSIDRLYRTLGETYWNDEELNYGELNALFDLYVKVKPRVMVTHDCPEIIANHLFNTTKLNDPSRTRQSFDSMWQAHKPQLWVFGHWHDHRNTEILGTRFVCLAELQAMELEI